MFKINKLKLFNFNNEEFEYSFEKGINYFKGTNDSGKTAFYGFIDFMFGASDTVFENDWFKDTLSYSIMEFKYNAINYCVKRTSNNNSYFKYSDEDWGNELTIEEYKEKLNAIFSIDKDTLKEMRDFVEEDLTFRTFTIFNFLSENRQGELYDFFSNARKDKFIYKLPFLLNFIFNKNLEEISMLKKKLLSLKDEVSNIESQNNKNEFIKNNVNINLSKLKIQKDYNFNNKYEILNILDDIKNLEDDIKIVKSKTINELEIMYHSLSEQIASHEQKLLDNKQFENDNVKRNQLLKVFSKLIQDKNEYEYLISPLVTIIEDLDKSVAFSKYRNSTSPIKELKLKKNIVKNELKIKFENSKMYDISEKSRIIAIIEDYISQDSYINNKDLNEKKDQINKIKREIKILQTADDIKKINKLSETVTELYKSAEFNSNIVNQDFSQKGFYIQYHKKGNILQPIIEIEENDESKFQNYNIGSMARHTLIQLCGYLGFLQMLLSEKKYPFIPILVIDHISKQFDNDNRKAIGSILKKFYELVEKDDFQIFVFDDKDPKDSDIEVDKFENLVLHDKTGFNPFYTKKSKK